MKSRNERTSTITLALIDDGVRAAAWTAAAEAAGVSRMRWAVLALDAALPEDVRAELPALRGRGFPAGQARKITPPSTDAGQKKDPPHSQDGSEK
mgnify:CR=1 FL=1